MASCSSCGRELPADAEYCPGCGTRQVLTTQTATTIPETTVPTDTGLGGRMIRALRAESQLYEEVEHDPNASQQVLLVIGIVAVAEAVGVALENLVLNQPLSGLLVESVVGLALTVIGLFIWSHLLYYIGTRLFQGKATPQEVWRAAGFARSPGIFFVIPFVGRLAALWMIYTNIIAARQALDLSTGKAVLASILSFIPYAILIGIIDLVIRSLL